MEAKTKRNTIIILAVITIVCLILFVPYTPSYASCATCAGRGWHKCSYQESYEYLSGKKLANHDCERCTNGRQLCSACNGTGEDEDAKTSNFERIMGGI